MPRMISTSFITGTGFMKCMPMNFSGRSVAAASRVIEIEEVLEAMIALGLRMRHQRLKIVRLMSSFSVAASITRSQSASASIVGAGVDAPQRRLTLVFADRAACAPAGPCCR